MPFMDGTGPFGEGSRSGRGRSRCAAENPGTGRSTGLGRRWANRTMQDPIADLEREANFLERCLNRIKRQTSGQGGGEAA